MARCAVSAAFSGNMHGDSHVIENSFSPLNAGWDGAALPTASFELATSNRGLKTPTDEPHCGTICPAQA